MGKAEVLAGTVEVSTQSAVEGGSRLVHARAGFDTMCSQNLITKGIVDLLGATPVEGEQVQLQTAGGTREADEWVTLSVKRPGFQVQLPLLVVDSLPGVDLLVRKADLSHLGYQIVDHAPPEEPSSPLQRAKKALADCLDVWVPLPGAPQYRARLRRLHPGEHKDEPQQLYAFEIDWDDVRLEGNRLKEYQRFARRSKVDYSIPMLKSLSPAETQCYTEELDGMVRRKWWREGEPDPDERPLDLPCCTFPLSQGAHKSTKVRLCSDMRGPNHCLPVASYSGHSVPEVLGTLRARVGLHDHLELIDLQKAFYRIRLARGRCVNIRTAGRSFRCGRVVFGIRCGPAALAAQVTLLLNCAYTGLLGRAVSRRDTKEFLEIGGGVSALPYYDDIALFGDADRVIALRDILVEIAPLLGAACPPEKRDTVAAPRLGEPAPEPVRHMGVYWSRAADGRLLMRCVEHDGLKLPGSDTISRRQVFSIAGAPYDGVQCHACSRAASDHLRRWAGRSPAVGGNPQSRATWDHQWPINRSTKRRLQQLLAIATSDDYGHCQHSSVPPHHDCLVAHCDSSSDGYGILLHSASSKTSAQWSDLTMPDKVLLESHAGAFDASLRKAHINRKEYLTVLKCLNIIAKWVGWFPASSQHIRKVVVYCDNASAVAWSQTDKLNGSIYDQAAIARAADAMAQHRHHLQHDRHISLDITHIHGLRNVFADRLSRLPSALPDLPPLGGDEHQQIEEEGSSAHPRRQAAVVLCVLDEQLCLERFGHSAHHAYSPCLIASGHDPMPGERLEDHPPVPDVVLAVGPGGMNAGGQRSRFDDTKDLANMDPEEVLELEAEALNDDDFCDKTEVGGVKLRDLVLALKNELDKTPQTQSAYALARGGAHGPYFRLNGEDGVLEHRDPLVHDSWKVYLTTTRARQWALYRGHSHPLLAAHQGTPRACESIWKAGYAWDSLVADVRKAVANCHECQMGKSFAREPAQPLVRKRNSGRFTNIQLDFMAKPNDAKLGGLPETSPGGWKHLCVIVDEGTRVALAVPSESTSTRDVVQALLQWCACYGVPSTLQMDMAGAHQSRELAMFLRMMGVSLRPGVPRRPQSQGLTERLIRDIKSSIHTAQSDRRGYSTPWWAAALVAIMVHNHSTLYDTHLSPHELATGAPSPGLVSLPACGDDSDDESEVADAEGAANTWLKLHEWVGSAYALLTQVRNEKQLAAEMKSVVSCTQLNVFHAGDKVRLYRVIDGRRRVEGPFEVDHRDPKNCYLYFLKGRKFPAPLSHLLPYYEDDAEKKREDETGPHRAHLSSMLRGQMPLGITLADLRGGEWLVIRQLTTVDGGPTICYMAEFKRREGEKFLVGCLDRTASGKWVLPRSDDTDETVSAEDILGEQGFHPTRTRRIPPRVTEWLESHGISHVRH